MQPLAGVSSLGTAYTAAQVQAQLFDPTPNQEQWVYYLLNANGTFKADISKYVESSQSPPQIQHDTTRAVPRTFQAQIRADAGINDLRDLLQPRYRLTMPDSGYLEWAQGVFSASPPGKDIQRAQTWLTYQCPDLLQLLVDATFTTTYAVQAGTNYIGAIKAIVSDARLPTPIPVQVPDSGAVLLAALSWDYGTSRLKAITDLLAAISYFPPWIDERGQLRSSRVPDWNTVTPSATFDATSNQAVIAASMKVSQDPSQAFNQVLVIGEDPRRTPVVPPVYENSNPLSAVSTAKWHPKLNVVRDSSIPDVATAYLKARALAQQAARIYSELQPDTLCWPVGQANDVYRVIYQSADEGRVDANHLEVGWTTTCKTGSTTTHRLTRIVPS